MKETEWIKSAQAGDMNGFRQLIKYYGPIVERFSYQIGNQPYVVDDVVQEVFIRLYRFIHTIDTDSLTKWLYKVTLNVTRDMKRKYRRDREKIEKTRQCPTESYTSIEEMIIQDESTHHLHNTIQLLDEKYRVPLVLYYFQDLTYQEISDILGTRLSTIKTRIKRAKEKLKTKMLEQEERIHYVG